MKSTSRWLLFPTVMLALASAQAQTLPAAYASAQIRASNPVTGEEQTITSSDFGVIGLQGVSSATVAVGADSNGLAFVDITGGTSAAAASRPYVSGGVVYYWSIVPKDSGQAGSNDLVNVTVHSAGYFHTAYDMMPKQLGTYNLQPNAVAVALVGNFWTQTAGPTDQRAIGVTVGPFNMGVPNLPPPQSNQTQQEFAATQDSAFDQSFSLMARPGYQNFIDVSATAFEYVRGNPDYAVSLAHESWSFHAYIDPVITIDPAYADRYAIEMSAIPLVAVPEPASAWLLLAGLGGLVGLRRRRPQTFSS